MLSFMITSDKQHCCHLQAAAKRFKVTGTGKVVRRRPGKQHINEKKSSKRLSQLGKERVVNSRDVVHIVDEMPYAGIRK